MLKTAIDHPGPIAFRYPRGSATGIPVDPDPAALPLGKGEVLTHGEDILILAIGQSVNDALLAHEILSREGIDTTVVNCRFIKPLDVALIGQLARQLPRIITVEENVRQGGFGSAVLECLSDEGIVGFHLNRIGIADTFVEHGPQKLLRSLYGIDADAIVASAKQLLMKKR
jgi:1-deoxy-D-xylulose-5-phosphate synthase